MCPDDEKIQQNMIDGAEQLHYRRYIQDRFTVRNIMDSDIGLVALIEDLETGHTLELAEGDDLADGSIQVMPGGAVYLPPRADVQKFMLPHSAELSPMDSGQATRYRERMNDIFRQEQMEYSQSDPDGAIIILMTEAERGPDGKSRIKRSDKLIQ